MVSSKYRIDKLGIGFGGMYYEVMEMCEAMYEKFIYMEESFERLVAAAHINRKNSSTKGKVEN